MGGCFSGEVDPEVRRKNEAIGKIIRKEKQTLAKTIQILLLGAGESGKSTFLKQMRILFMEGIPKHEIPMFRDIIYSNVIVAIYTLCMAASDMGFSLLPENDLRAIYFSELVTEEGNNIVFDEEMGKEVLALWEDTAIQKAFQQSHRFQLSDSTAYFMGKLSSISKEGYIPSLDDILHSRSKTVGICEITFDFEDAHFKIIDVGGQRSERAKWIYCFEDVTAIIYFASLSEYNLALQEDASVNRMTESLKIFHQVVNLKWFKKTPIILFLNKSDIFREKISQPQHSLSKTFPKYEGGDDFEKGVELIHKKFLAMANDVKQVFVHTTCCTDTEQMKFVFTTIRDSLWRQLVSEFECPI